MREREKLIDLGGERVKVVRERERVLWRERERNMSFKEGERRWRWVR